MKFDIIFYNKFYFTCSLVHDTSNYFITCLPFSRSTRIALRIFFTYFANVSVVCGIASSSAGVPLIVNGTRASVSDFPWHGTLYRAKGNEKQFICGATIIKDNLLVTAAHCVYDEAAKKIETPSKFHVSAGNVFRDFDYEGNDKHIVKTAQVNIAEELF